MKARHLFVLMLVALMSSTAFAMGKPLPTETGDTCADEGLNFLRGHFPEQQVLLKSFKRVNWPSEDPTAEIWYRTSLCEGFFVGKFHGARGDECKIPLYGSTPRRLDVIWAEGQCVNLMPHRVYPR